MRQTKIEKPAIIIASVHWRPRLMKNIPSHSFDRWVFNILESRNTFHLPCNCFCRFTKAPLRKTECRSSALLKNEKAKLNNTSPSTWNWIRSISELGKRKCNNEFRVITCVRKNWYEKFLVEIFEEHKNNDALYSKRFFISLGLRFWIHCHYFSSIYLKLVKKNKWNIDGALIFFL